MNFNHFTKHLSEGLATDFSSSIVKSLCTSTINVECVNRKSVLERSLSLVVAKNDFIKDIVLFGSYGDNTSIDYSDLDILVVIHKNVLNNRDLIVALSKATRKEIVPILFSVNSLQHHGPFFYFEDLDFLPSDYLPAEALVSVKSVTGELFLNVEKASQDAKFDEICNRVLGQGLKALSTRLKYDIFQFVSSVLLLKLQYLQLTGMSVTKKDSFDVRVDFLESLARNASLIRRDWRKNKVHTLLLKFLLKYSMINPFVLSRYTGLFEFNRKRISLVRILVDDLRIICK